MLVLGLCVGYRARATSQVELDEFARALGYRFTVVANRAGADCPNHEECFVSTLDLTMPTRPFPGRWSLYFSFVETIVAADTAFFDFNHVNGDLYRLVTKPGVRFEPGKTYSIKIQSGGHFFSEYYAMPNAFVADDTRAQVIAASRAVFDPQTGLEQLPFVTPMRDEAHQATNSRKDATRWSTPASQFEHNAKFIVRQARPEFAVIPTVREARHMGGAVLDLRAGVTLRITGTSLDELAPALAFLRGMGVPSFERGPVLSIEVKGKENASPESYRIVVKKRSGISIEATDTAGAAYALRSLAEQVGSDAGMLRPFVMVDAPRFAFRGLHIDVARNFHSKAELLKLIEQMGVYKLNRLHLHLGDDEGWRLQIAELPELTEIGSVRCFDPSETRCILPQLGAGPAGDGSVNGYFSRQDYIDILRAAHARQIEVIPSFDMPGHSRAAIRSMEVRYQRLMARGQPEAATKFRLVEPEDKTVYRSIQNYNDNTLNVCLPATYRFVNQVVGEVAAMHEAAGVPLRRYHIGTDETAGAWLNSPACQAFAKAQGIAPSQFTTYFVTRVAKDLADRKIQVAGWSDGIMQVDAAKIPGRLQANSWQRLYVEGIAQVHGQINQGLDVVLSTPDTTYFDMPYAPDPREPGYDWAARGVDVDRVFGFMPQNLPANATLINDIENHGVTVIDTVPVRAGLAVIGLQGQLWSETVRSDSEVDYKLFPRVIALAERAWHTGDWEIPYQPGRTYAANDGQLNVAAFRRDYQSFRDRLTVHLGWLDRAGVRYRIPPVGARIYDGRLEANVPYGDFAIEYRSPGGQWSRYRRPIAVVGRIELRAWARGRPGRAMTVDAAM
jgi:hexosaminidase